MFDCHGAFERRKVVFAVILGQFLSVLIAATGVFSEILAREGVNVPTCQSACNYLLLALVYGSVVACRRHYYLGDWRPYAFLALMDVEANALLVSAYQYTSLTSVTLLDCFTIPTVIFLSILVLKTRYRAGHLVGAVLCCAAVALLVVGDSSSGGGSYTSAVWGDCLVLMGATLYAAANVMQEGMLGSVCPVVVLAMLGAYGTGWSVLQAVMREWPALMAIHWTPTVIMSWVGFGISMFTFYSLVPLQLMWGGAAMLNLSLLSADLWAAAARVVFFGGFTTSSAVYFSLSLAITALGLLTYTLAGDVTLTHELEHGVPLHERLPGVQQFSTEAHPGDVVGPQMRNLGSTWVRAVDQVADWWWLKLSPRSRYSRLETLRESEGEEDDVTSEEGDEGRETGERGGERP